MKKIVVFILNYRAISFLKDGSLNSTILAAKNIKDAKVNLVFLDNYSMDGSVEYVLKNNPEVDVLVSPRNYMYCRGINVGLQYIYKRYKPDYYILVDADNYCEPNTYDELVKFAILNKRAGLVQPLVKNSLDKNILYSCGHHYIDDIFCRPLREIPSDKKQLIDLPSCSISSTLVKAEVFEKCGLLDPIFELYYESSDLSFRSRKAGFSCACHMSAVSYNDGAKVSEVNNFHEGYYRNRNGLIFWKKHDENVYQKLLQIQLSVYDKLNDKLNKTEYGLGIIDESTRRGIEEGIRITSNLGVFEERVVRLDEYNKTDAVLLQSGSFIANKKNE